MQFITDRLILFQSPLYVYPNDGFSLAITRKVPGPIIFSLYTTGLPLSPEVVQVPPRGTRPPPGNRTRTSYSTGRGPPRREINRFAASFSILGRCSVPACSWPSSRLSFPGSRRRLSRFHPCRRPSSGGTARFGAGEKRDSRSTGSPRNSRPALPPVSYCPTR